MHSQDDDKTIVVDTELVFLYSIISDQGKKVQIENELTIGRSSENTIFIDDKKISRKHAVITLNENCLQVNDLGSSNGTFVNDIKINKKTTLKNKDVISFEKHTYTVCIEINPPQPKIPLDESNDDALNEKSIENKIEKAQESIPTEESKDIPTSWTEDNATVAGTRMMDLSELAKLREGPNIVGANESGITQLHCFIDGVEEIFELPIKDANSVSGWEIGRDSKCDITIDHTSVSGRHAQIIHQNGRWKIVNLVSTNGILINGQRKLSTYLADGDKVGLGTVNLVFNIPDSPKKSTNNNIEVEKSKESKSLLVPILMVMLLIVLSVIIYMLIK